MHLGLATINKSALFYFGLIAAVIAAYANIYVNQFLYDDVYLIVENRFLQHWRYLPDIFRHGLSEGSNVIGHVDAFYRPLQSLFYLVLYQLFGPSTVAFHALNLSLHAANACLLLNIGRALGARMWPMFFATLLWALHPLHAEAVTYMSATADVLYSFFCLLALRLMLPDFALRRMMGAGLCFVLALLSKEAAVSLPMLAVCIVFLASPLRREWRSYRVTWPLWLILFVYAGLRVLCTLTDIPNAVSQPLEYRLFTFLATLPEYASLLLWPDPLYMEREFGVRRFFFTPVVMLGAAIVMLALWQLAWGRGKHGIEPSFAILWFASAHALHSGLLCPMNSQFLEHWMYLPTAGFALAGARIASAGRPSPRHMKMVAVLVVSIAMVLGVVTHLQNRNWKTPETFFTHILEHEPSAIRALNHLGMIYMDRKEYNQAITLFSRSVFINRNYWSPMFNLALALARKPGPADYSRIIAACEYVIKNNPTDPRPYGLLGEVYGRMGDLKKARMYWREYDLRAEKSS